MNQPNEHVFFNDRGMYISQYRFITHTGDMYPTRTLLRVFSGQDREEGCRRVTFVFFFGFLILVSLILLVWGGSILATFDYQETTMTGYYRDNSERQMRGIVLTIIGVIGTPASTLLTIKLIRGRRRRYFAHFVFAGGANPAVLGGGVNPLASRNPDYSAWSYDEEWTRNLIAAANDAILAAQQT